MVNITPGTALLAALNAQYNAARQGRNPGAGSSIPGLPAAGQSGDPAATFGQPAGGISGGGVPSTATTGQGLAASIGGGAAVGGDPVAQQVARVFGGFGEREPNNPSGASLGEFDNLQGGNVNVLRAMMTGNPIIIAAAIAAAVAGQSAPPQGFGADAQGGTPFSFGDSTPGASNAGVNLGSNPLTNPSGGVNFGGPGLSFGGGNSAFGGGDSTPGASLGGPGESPRRGDISNAGR